MLVELVLCELKKVEVPRRNLYISQKTFRATLF